MFEAYSHSNHEGLIAASCIEKEGPGRDEDCSPPPGQIPACAANAPGSSLGFWRRSGEEAAGVAP
jgi:hypothetical protein